ncbi:DNA-processing protein DprA [Rhabdothermincola sp.]|uniref:DNA-processing protein DprA n=1 Tax=Rhabdothermincola sp. TaxID=2820405 RepID=UPI002FDF5206
MPDTTELPTEAHLLALASLPQMGPARLSALVEAVSPAEAWHELCRGAVPGGGVRELLGAPGAAVVAAWARRASELDVGELWRHHLEAGVEVCGVSSPAYPEPFRGEEHPPPLVVLRGDRRVLDGPRVAVVGTRDCTRYGRDVAFELGRDLAAAGVRVVSGLALGIDGAAHTGALEARAAPPVAVVGSGLDVVYPRRNHSLWRAVADAGLLISEHPLGTSPAAWHFPARNRLIAALADIVVVVESHARGGALHTATEAAQRGRPVMAVPGSVRAHASEGTNRLFDEGAHVCLGAGDVLALLGLDTPARRRGEDPRPVPEPADARVLEQIGWEPVALEQLVLRTGLELGSLVLALDRLEAAGWVARRAGWFERVAHDGR